MIKVYVHNEMDFIAHGAFFFTNLVRVGENLEDYVVFDRDDWTEIGEL